MKLCVVLFLLPLSTCLAAVVNDFTVSCPQFFPTVKGVVTAPTRFTPGTRYKQICQTLKNVPEFATLYDIASRIPVYSAYRFRGRAKCTRKTGNWFIEPQLDDTKLGSNMDTEGTVPGKVRGGNQALNGDYSNPYHKGHLIPVYHADKQKCADATFTLTNAAPQYSSFNSGPWRVTESDVSEFLTTNCINSNLRAYTVTGVVPGTTKLNNRVIIPSYFWMAHCCFDNNDKPSNGGGYYGQNQAGSKVVKTSVQALQTSLSNWYGTPFTLFGGVC